MESFNQIFSTALLLFSILSLGALSGLFSERSGTVNIAIEGLMTFGALFYAISGYIFHKSGYSNNMQFLSLIIAGFFASIISLLFAYSVITLKSNQVIAGTAINLLAGGIAVYLAVDSSWSQAGVIRSSYKNINLASHGFAKNINSFIIISIAIIGIAYTVINFTKWGLRMRACGENPQAADSSGINVIRMRYVSVLISGFLAGIAGGMFVNNSAYIFNGNVQGYGFIALTIMIFGQWRTSLIAVTAILFSFLSSIAIEGQYIEGLNKIPKEIIMLTPYIFSILILIILSKRSRAPASAGQPYEKNKR